MEVLLEWLEWYEYWRREEGAEGLFLCVCTYALSVLVRPLAFRMGL
jgi:hypothetical protein